ncbi:MAG: Crp/Fnr family transcriptional regulator [Myxococcota bacterium]
MAAKDDPRAERRRVLANVSVFAGLDASALDALMEITATRRLRSGEVLFRKGAEGSQLYGVLRGRLRISAAGEDGREMTFGFSEPGEVIGEIAILDANPRSATVTALAPCELLTLDRRDLLPFLERHPVVAIHLARVLAGRLRRLSEMTEDAMLRDLPVRLAKKLVVLARSEPAGAGPPEVRVSQQQLGELVGTSRESINKQLRSWVDDGIVQTRRGGVRILDLPSLEAVAGLSLV